MSLRTKAEAIATTDQHQAGKLKRELAAERKAHEAARKELADLHSAYDLIENATQVNARAVARGRKLRRGKATSVFCASDWHCEEHVEPEVIDYANSFDLDEADRRIKRTFRKFVLLHNVQQHIAKVGDAVLWLGGDLINGYIHAELEESNFLGPAEAVQWVTDRVAGGIDYLLAELNCPLRVVCNYGNHGRATVKPRASTGYKTSWEWGLYHSLARVYRDERRVSWNIARGMFAWEQVQALDVRFHHGDGVKYHGGVGGLTVPMNKAVAQWNKQRRADLDVIGHYHQETDGYWWLVNGSLVGWNAYAERIKAEYRLPTQTYFLVERDYGRILTAPVFCTERTASKEAS